MTPDKIGEGVIASITYRLIVDGEVIEEAQAEEPLEYLHGAENIVPGLEAALAGKSVGDRVNVTLQPEDAYGDFDEENFETVPRDDLPDDIEEGMEILIEDEEGYLFEATVSEINSNEVVLDFNSPLAGKVVTYEAEVLGLREADESERDHGHPHSYHDEMDH